MKINQYLEKKKLTRDQFSTMLGVTLRTVYNILSCSYLPNLQVAVKIEEITNGKIKPRHIVEDYNAYRSNKAKAVPRKRGKKIKRAVH